MYSKILVPVDGSDNSIRALRHGLFLSFKLGSKLTILYVLEIPPVVYVQSQKVIDSVMSTLEKEAKDIFNAVNLEAQNYDIIYETILLKGQHVASLINEYADQKDIDIIMMGSRGTGKIKTAILGSVAHNVFHLTKKPVLIIK
jgi:nucleotide-binding universal stress UspA family protein